MTARRPLTNDDLERALVDLGSAIAWPATRDLWPAVLVRIAGTPVPAHGRDLRASLDRLAGTAGSIGRRPIRRSLIVALVVLLAAAAIATAFGIGVPGIRIFFGPVSTVSPPGTSPPATSPPATAGTAATSSPQPTVALPTASSDPPLGQVVSLLEARSSAGFPVLVPTLPTFGDPATVLLAGQPPLARVSLSYGPGGLITEFVGSADPNGFQKMVGSGTTVEPLTINGAAAYWITGAPHELIVLYRDGNGNEDWETMRVEGNVHVWQAGSITLRLETPLGRVDAVRIAGSMR
jgi:hypothetical protein